MGNTKHVTFEDDGMQDSLLRRIQWIPEDEREEHDSRHYNCMCGFVAFLTLGIGCIIYAINKWG